MYQKRFYRLPSQPFWYKKIIEDFKFLEESEIKKKYNITKESRDQKVAYAQRNVKEFGIKDEFLRKLSFVHSIRNLHISQTDRRDS